jgi:hypothetical protein
MTTTVTIKHDGPRYHDVIVATVTPATGGRTSERQLRPGEQVTLYVYDTQALAITEAPHEAAAA